MSTMAARLCASSRARASSWAERICALTRASSSRTRNGFAMKSAAPSPSDFTVASSGGMDEIISTGTSRNRSSDFIFASSCRPSILRSEEHTSELQSQSNLVCRLLLEKKNYRRSGLPLQCLLGFIEQPHVFDGDHGLVGDGLQQLNVMGCERPGLGARHADHADRRALA